MDAEFRVRIDPEVMAWAQNALANFDVAVVNALNLIAADAATRAQANAPIKSGDLRRSIRAEDTKRTSVNVFTAQVVAGERYALRMHELLTPTGPLNLGPLSAAQPMTPEGGVGSKYIQRAVFFNMDRYQNGLRTLLGQTLGQHARISVGVRTQLP